jgi:EAL domain-containing protein (putative c-di-GMP-specific phosphodiesterase class I)
MRLGAVLREEADAALYEAKRRRADDVVGFSEIGEDAAILSPEKAHGLRLLLQDRVIDVALQPIWDLESGTLLGLEGLARPHVEYGLSGPAEAFDVAEQTGRIADLDRLCVDRILERAGELPRGARLFVNVHPSSLEDEDGEWIFDALRRARVHHERIVIEVTERSGARVGAVVRAIASLRARGLKVALDDVGAGNSGLQMLQSVGVDFVKIDRMVVVRAMEQTSARAVLAAIIAFAETSGTYVIAEGIEDRRMLAFLEGLEVRASNGIRGGQGYGLGRPASTVAAAIAGGPVASSEVVKVVEPQVAQELAGLDVQVRELA